MQLLVNNAYVYEAHVNELGKCTLSPTERKPYVMEERTSRSGTDDGRPSIIERRPLNDAVQRDADSY